MLGAVLAAFVGLVAAQCRVPPNWNCSVPSYSKCVATCPYVECFDPNITEACAESTSLTSCEALPNCTWKTTYCKRMHYCESNNGTECNYIGTCSDQGPHCYDAEYCEEATDYCDASTDQAACTETPGCFWYEITTMQYIPLVGTMNVVNMSRCSRCFQPHDSENNIFYLYQKPVGHSCYIYGSLVNFTSATAASTGCSGGQTQSFAGAICFQVPTPTTSTPTPTPTTLAPSSGCTCPTGAPTDSTVSGAVARGAVGLMAGTLLGTFLLA